MAALELVPIPSPLAAVALLLALAACYDKSDHGPTSPEALAALTVTASATSLPADGFSTLDIVAQIDPDADSSRRSVQFQTTAGTFVGTASATSVTVAADVTGRAVAILQSAPVVQTAIVQVSVAGAASVVRTIEIAFTAVDPTTLLRISTSSASAPADGATTLRVHADVASGLPTGSRTVSFTTSLGTFASGGTTATAVADGSNRATVDLVAPGSVGTARLTATAAGTTAETTVSFVRALPSLVQVTTDKLALRATLDDSTDVTTTLLRDVGTVTAGTVVEYDVLDSDGNDLSFLIGSVTPSDASGRSTAVISAGATTYRGRARIRASVPGGTAGETLIEVVDP